MKLNISKEAIERCRKHLEEFTRIARGAIRSLRIRATADGVTLVAASDHDRTSIALEGASVTEPGDVWLSGDAAMLLLTAPGDGHRLATVGRSVHLAAKVGGLRRIVASAPLLDTPTCVADGDEPKAATVVVTGNGGGMQDAIVVDGPELRKALSRVAYPGRQPHPTMECIRLAVSDGGLELQGSDLTSFVAARISAAVGAKARAFAALIDRNVLKELARRLRKGTQVTLRPVDDLVIEIEAGGTKITAHGRRVEDWPVPPPMTEVVAEVSSDEVTAAIGKVLVAMTADPSRFAIQGVLVSGRDVVATDGHRLHRRRLKTACPRMVLPAGHGLKVLAGLGPVRGTLDATRVTFRGDGVEITLPLQDVTFPQYEKLIPTTVTGWHRLALGSNARAEWIAKLASLPVATRSSTVKCRLNGCVEMTSGSDVTGYGHATVGIGLDGGGDIEVQLNRDYLIDALSADVEELFIKSPETPVYLRGAREDVLVMPMRA